MNFFPIGPMMRRTGVFFIRRSFKDNPLYKTVLKSYLDYLIEKRFPLEWYMEGGRSRSGRLGVPTARYAQLCRRLAASREERRHPVDPGLDRLRPDPGRARLRPRGAGKGKAEGVAGLAVPSCQVAATPLWGHPHPIRRPGLGSDPARLDRRGRRGVDRPPEARIRGHVPDRPGDPGHAHCHRHHCPARGQGERHAPQIKLAEECARLSEFVVDRSIPTTEALDLSDPERVSAILDWLAEHGNVSSHEAVGRRVFWLDEDQMVRIAYYRNVIVHFFVPGRWPRWPSPRSWRRNR